MNDIITIAQSTFQRVAGMKALYVILAICVMDVAAMAAYKEISLGMERELMTDCALAISLVVGLLSAMVAAFEIPRELREKTAQFILSKPMGRSAFVWGKFLGVSSLAVFNVAFVTIGSLVAYKLSFGEAKWALVGGGILIAAESVTLVGIGLLLSIFLTDTLAAIGMFACFVIGHSLYIIPRASSNVVGKALTYIFPNFYNLDIKTEISHAIDIPNAFIGMGVLYAVCYALFVTSLAIVIFSRRDIS